MPFSRAEGEWVDAAGSEPIAATSEDVLWSRAAELAQAAVVQEGLAFSTALVRQAMGVLAAGKHLLMVGPPGTGKTTLGALIARAAQTAGLCTGVTDTTGSSDWTPAETVGTYRLHPGDNTTLVFEPGQVVQAMQANRWLVIDELNRADIDRALGPLFTVLSGQPTTLPYLVPTEGGAVNVRIVPERIAASAPGTIILRHSWRLIATMNTLDRDVLFDISHALVRRFGYLHVPVPPSNDHLKLLQAKFPESGVLSDRFRALVSNTYLPLGPAITLDAAEYVSAQLRKDASLSPATAFAEAVELFIRPQLQGIMPELRAQAEQALEQIKVFHGDATDGEEVVSPAPNELDSPLLTSLGEMDPGA